MCTNKQCKLQRAHLNPNSFEHISKRKKISLQEADKWMKSHNKSPFYKHPWDTDQQYSKRQARSLDYFIEKYENGKQRWYNYCKKISNANKQQQVIKRHGEEYNTRLQNSKKQTLQNFILRYGQIEGKQKYINWITAATQLGIYINNKKIQSKSAYNFFKLLEIELINNNICKSQDILFADGNKSEYILKYFEDDKFKFYKLDFVILKYKIDIQFNGRAWHYDFQNEQKNKYFVGMKKNIKQYEYKRNTKIKQEGFNLFIVWEDDIFNEIDKKKTIQKLILDIKQIINAENSNEKLK